MIQGKKNISDKGDDEGNENILCLEENKYLNFIAKSLLDLLIVLMYSAELTFSAAPVY